MFPSFVVPIVCRSPSWSSSSAPPYLPMSSGSQAGWWCCDVALVVVIVAGRKRAHCHPASRGLQRQCRACVSFRGWAMWSSSLLDRRGPIATLRAEAHSGGAGPVCHSEFQRVGDVVIIVAGQKRAHCHPVSRGSQRWRRACVSFRGWAMS